MAIANAKSQGITDLDAAIPKKIDSHNQAGYVVQSADAVNILDTDDDGSVYRMVRVPSNARIISLGILNTAMALATDYDLGVYDTAEKGGAVVDADLFSSAISMVGQRTLPLNAKYESAVISVSGIAATLWEALGLSEDPKKSYDVCYTANTVGTDAGTLALESTWAI